MTDIRIQKKCVFENTTIRNISLISDFKLSIEKHCEYKKLCRIKHFLFANILETKITFVLILIRI